MTHFQNKKLKQKNFKYKFAQTIIAIFLSQSLSLMPLPTLASDNNVRIAGQPVFTVPSASDASSIAQRTANIQENLDNALVAAKDRTPSSVNITYVKGTPVITLGGYQVATITTADAATAKTTPALLANQWADKIRGALADQSSINAYIAQLSDTYASSAPPVKTNNYPPANSTQYSGNQIADSSQTPNVVNNLAQPSQSSFAPNNSRSYDSYNANSSNNNSPASANLNANPTYGNAQQNSAGINSQGGAGGQGLRQGRIAYAQSGQIIPLTLATSIATQVARVGDFIQATVSQNVTIGDSVIPSGTQVLGQVTDAKAGGHLTHSGKLQIKFNRLRLPDGSETPITAHIVGGIGKYTEIGGDQSDEYTGETTKNKVGSVAFRGLLGAGGGAALGTAVGAIAGGGYGAGMGAWSGAAIGGGLGAADSLLLRKGKDVTIPSGTSLKLQLDSPVAISGVAPANYQ